MADPKRWARGEFCWYELGTRNLEAAKRFYSGLFGWSAREVPMGPDDTYTMLEIGGRVVGGAYVLKGAAYEGVPAHWLAYVATDALDADAARALSLGGTAIVGPLDVPGVGRIVMIRDPQGAVVAMFQEGGNPGAARFDGIPGGFCWTELAARDAVAAVAFYTGVFGWGTEKLDTGRVPYTQWRVGDRLVGGMMAIPPEWSGVPPHWMSYVSVRDCDAVAAQAEALGGRIVVPPQDVENVGRFAVLSDHEGAVLAVLKLA